MSTPVMDRTARRVCLLSRLVLPGMGDLVQRNIYLHLLRRAYPDAVLSWVVADCVDRIPYQREAVRRHSYADEILVCPDADHDSEEKHPQAWHQFRKDLASRGFEVCVVDPGSRRAGAADAHAAGITVRVAVPRGLPDDSLITHPIRLPRPVVGINDLYDYAAALASALGTPAPRPTEAVPRLPLRPEPLPSWVDRRPLVGVHPAGAKGWHRRWPLARYAELCVRLARDAGATLLVLGSSDEADEAGTLQAAVLARYPAASIWLSLGEPLNRVANLIDRMDLLIGNDSAPAHLAAALATPTVVIYGPTGTEPLWTRVYPRHRGVNLRYPCQNLRHEPDEAIQQCEHGCPCHYTSPDGPYPKCLTDISVDDVWQASLAQLSRGRP